LCGDVPLNREGLSVSRLTDLLRQVRKADNQLGADLEAEFRALTSRRTFGLVFERHVPEEVELPHRPVRKGDKVHVLPSRGGDDPADTRLWSVVQFENSNGTRNARLAELGTDTPESRVESVKDLVVVAEFRDPIYPGLVETGRVERGGDKPFHSVINAENYHALELLTYTHKGKVDCIYIDPPYNTGAKDWKYNNHYVEGDDTYRHSKWLAFMERRLKIARELLDPDDSVLIVTIDEKEYLRLGLLLEQTYPEARIQMVSSVINPKGATRSTSFGRTDEYVYFVMFGKAGPSALPLGNEWKVVIDARAETLRWAELLRSGTNARRVDRPRLFYPVFVRNSQDGAVFDSVGESIEGVNRDVVIPPDGCVAVWPIRSDDSEGNWQINGSALTALVDQGYVRFGPWRDERTTISYLKRGEQRKVEEGVFPVVGRRLDGSVVIDSSSYTPVFIPGTQWRITYHEAGGPGGSGLLRALMPDRRFPFPKALYAVEDALRFFVKDKPGAVVLDFFSGSGTTAHAVMRLNRQDGGRRQCISVTNNEVAADQQAALRAQGIRPGDVDWEQWGICEYITKPRIESAITGRKPDGEPVAGNYRFVDEFPIADGFDENAVFFTQTYEGPLPVAHHRAFDRVAPILWLRAGARGEIISGIPDEGWAIAESYGVLDDLDASSGFLRAVAESQALNTAYIITDDDLAFQMVCRDLPSRVTPVQLYESYLQNFELNSGRLG
jgi:adenine-specific DNA-methyltransferase